MTTASAKAYKGMGMEGMVAKWYATNTRKALNEFKALARRISSELPSGSSVLEVAPGPGLFRHRIGEARQLSHHRSRHQPDVCRNRGPQCEGSQGRSRVSTRQRFKNAIRRRQFPLYPLPGGV